MKEEGRQQQQKNVCACFLSDEMKTPARANRIQTKKTRRMDKSK